MRLRQLPVLVILVCGLLAAAGAASAGTVMRIMPVGDSITTGYTNAPDWTIPFTFGYRGPLVTKLTEAGYDFQFVGTSGEPWNLPYGAAFGVPTTVQGPDLRTAGQNNHRGYGGATTSQILNGGVAGGSTNAFPSIVGMLNADDPDIVLLMIGTNGIPDAMNNIDPLVNAIVTTKPDAQLIVAQIPPRASGGIDPTDPTVQYNDYIKNMVTPKYQALGKNVSTVDQFANLLTPGGAIDASLLCPDGAHLRPAANELLAQTWLEGIGSATIAEGERPKLEKSELKKLRKQAANRQRRIVYNDDGCHGTPGNTSEDWLACRVRHVTNTQVDTICYCTGGGGLFWSHQSKVGEVLGDWVEEGHGQYVKQMRDTLIAMKEQRTDPLAVVVDYAHQHNQEVFWSYRMNNPECSFATWGLSQRKRDNPEYIMGVKADWKKYPHSNPKAWYTLSDYENPEVRDHIVRIFEDVCQRYDIDGIELDFIRHPLFFRPNLEGEPVKSRHVEMMTDMLRRIRAVSERESIKRGRPILVTVRVPLSVKSCMAIGLDIRVYLEEDLMDIMIAGQDYIQMAVASSLKDMVDLGHQYQVPVYALLVPPKPYDRYRHDNRAWWAAAMNRWYWGADGIYLFNLFPTKPDERFGQLGSVETLKGRDKIYAIDNPAQEAVLGTFKLVMVGPNRLPITLVPRTFVMAKLPVGEDIMANTPSGKTVSTLLRLRLAGMVQGDEIKVTFNGHPLVVTGPVKPLATTPSNVWFHITTDPKLVKAGYNLIGVQLGTKRNAATPVVLDGLDVAVSYSDRKPNEAHGQ